MSEKNNFAAETEVEKENNDLKYLKMAENCFNEKNFEKAVVLMKNINEDTLVQRARELMGGSDDQEKLAEEMYLKRNWIEETNKKIEETKDSKEQPNLGLKVTLKKGKNGKMETGFCAKNPMFFLLKAEDNFENGDFFNAWLKITTVSSEDQEKRKQELLNGDEKERKLADQMYVDTGWMKEVEKEWRETDAHNDREFREKKWERIDSVD